MRLLFWYSGEHSTLPAVEARAAFEAEGHDFRVLQERPRFQVAETEAFGSDVLATVARLGLTHDVSSHLFDVAPDRESILAQAQTCSLDAGCRFAVRAERLAPRAALRGPDAERIVGQALRNGRTVDLRAPDVVVRVFVDGNRLWAGRRLWDRDPKETAARHVKHRPRSSPVSLPPKLARALVNLARVPRDGVLYDPCCGTGGILIEAAAMGIRVVGSDLDPDMAEATRTNLQHFDFFPLDTFAGDVGAAPAELLRRKIPPVDAVVTDLPYGRSASTGKEALSTLYDRAFEAIAGSIRPGGYAVVGVPAEAAARRAAEFLPPVDHFSVRVHRSLTRHFVVLRRAP